MLERNDNKPDTHKSLVQTFPFKSIYIGSTFQVQVAETTKTPFRQSWSGCATAGNLGHPQLTARAGNLGQWEIWVTHSGKFGSHTADCSSWKFGSHTVDWEIWVTHSDKFGSHTADWEIWVTHSQLVFLVNFVYYNYIIIFYIDTYTLVFLKVTNKDLSLA